MRLLRHSVWLTALLISVGIHATTFDREALTNQFEKNLGATVTEIKPSDINGLLEVHTSRGIIFTSPDGKFFIAGKLYEFTPNGHYFDVLAKRQAPLNAQKIEKMKDQMIIYKAKNEKYVVSVFTDITCGYCSKLHAQMKQYNDLGITIRYLAFPRQGAGSEVAEQMATIWCAEDRNAAMNTVEKDRTLPKKNALFGQCLARVNQQYNLGVELGVRGTPAMFLPDGEMIGGYLPPEQLLARLQSLKTH